MPVGVCKTRSLVSMFVGREAPFKPVMCRIQQNKSLGLGWVPLDSVTVMIILRISVWRLEQLLLSEAIPASPGFLSITSASPTCQDEFPHLGTY